MIFSWEEAIVAYLKMLSRNMCGEIGPRIGQGTSQIISYVALILSLHFVSMNDADRDIGTE
jgi:hypothetical protein